MILNDIISDYNYVSIILDEYTDYFRKCEELSSMYHTSLFNNIADYFYPEYNEKEPENDENSLTNSFDWVFNKIHDNILDLVRNYPESYSLVARLKMYKYKNDFLYKTIHDFTKLFQKIFSHAVSMISEYPNYFKRKGPLPYFISLIDNLLRKYKEIHNLAVHFTETEETLVECIPEKDSKGDYNRIELYSRKPSGDFDSLSTDISYLAQFISRFESIMNTEHSSNKIYIQRIESGSLKVVFGSNRIKLSAIENIIRAICDGIRSFRLTSPEKKLLDEQARSAKLDNDQKELAIINSKAETIARILGLSAENQEDKETLQKACLPLIRYLVSNPQGKVGEYEYNLDDDIKLIEYFDSKNNS